MRRSRQNDDFSSVIARAKRRSSPQELETGEIVGGFAHDQVMALKDKLVGAVKSGKIRKFVVMAGCDGRRQARECCTRVAMELPLAFDIAWYEQKAVAVLLALPALGFRNIRLGPTLPAFLSPSVLRTLVERFGLCGIGNVGDDVKSILA